MNALVLIICLNIRMSIVSHPEAWLRQAESLGGQKLYASAAEIYRLLIVQGFWCADLDYNLGVCALAQGNVAEAIYHLRRAVSARPWVGEYTHALALARRFVPDGPAKSWDYYVLIFWTRTVFLVSWSTGWCCLIGFYFRQGRRWATLGLLLLSISMVSLAVYAYGVAQEQEAPWVVVREQCVPHIGNGTSYPVVLKDGKPVVVYPGQELRALAQRANGWVYIRWDDENRGWIPKSALYLSAEPIEW